MKAPVEDTNLAPLIHYLTTFKFCGMLAVVVHVARPLVIMTSSHA